MNGFSILNVLVLVLVLVLVPVLVLVLVLCSCSCTVLLLLLEPVVLVVPAVVLVRGPRSWSSLSTLCRRGSRCPRCPPAPHICLACVLVLLLEEQRRENPHATAGNVREQSYALTCSTCLFAEAVFAEDPPPSSTEQQSAPSRWREFRAKLFFPRRRPRAGAAGADRAGGSAPALFSRGGSQGELMGPVTQYHR